MKTAIDERDIRNEAYVRSAAAGLDGSTYQQVFEDGFLQGAIYASQFCPRPYSLDPKDENYKVPEVGQWTDLFVPAHDYVSNGYQWNERGIENISKGVYVDYLWLPSRTASDFKP